VRAGAFGRRDQGARGGSSVACLLRVEASEAEGMFCKSLILKSIPNESELEPLRVLPHGTKPFTDNEMGRLEAKLDRPEILPKRIVP